MLSLLEEVEGKEMGKWLIQDHPENGRNIKVVELMAYMMHQSSN